MESEYSVKRLDGLIVFREYLDFLKQNKSEEKYIAMLRMHRIM